MSFLVVKYVLEYLQHIMKHFHVLTLTIFICCEKEMVFDKSTFEAMWNKKVIHQYDVLLLVIVRKGMDLTGKKSTVIRMLPTTPPTVQHRYSWKILSALERLLVSTLWGCCIFSTFYKTYPPNIFACLDWFCVQYVCRFCSPRRVILHCAVEAL